MATLPVLPLTDAVLLPGMVVPVTLDTNTQAAVDAARAAGDNRVLAVPRVDGEYGSMGAVALIEKVGRLPSGEPAAVVRGISRARIGSGVPGPGAALWVEATELDEPAPAGKARELASEYKTLVTGVLQQRGAWQVIDAVERMTDLSELADSAGYAPWLTLEQKVELLGSPDVTSRLELLVGWVRDHIAEQEVTERINNDVREGLEKSQREFLLRQQLAAIRKELGEDEPDGVGRLPHPRRGRRSCPTTSARRRCARSASSNAPATSRRSRAGSAPGSTPCWRCRGRPAPRTTPTSARPVRCSTPTTPACPT